MTKEIKNWAKDETLKLGYKKYIISTNTVNYELSNEFMFVNCISYAGFSEGFYVDLIGKNKEYVIFRLTFNIREYII